MAGRTNAEQPDKDDPLAMKPVRERERSNSLIYYGALAFIYIACMVFVAAAFRLYTAARTETPASNFHDFYPELFMTGIAIFAGILGVSLLRSVGSIASAVPGPVIHPAEWAAISPEVIAGREDAITQYVRLRSLTGFTGLFTKLGLTGLPLATIGLTLFFALIYLYDTANKEYIELAKLTLGAFIGSFVQKQVGERQSIGGTVQLPSGEKLKVQSAPPPTVA